MVLLNSWRRTLKNVATRSVSAWLVSLVSAWVVEGLCVLEKQRYAVGMTGTRREKYRILGVAKCRKVLISTVRSSMLMRFYTYLISFCSPHATFGFKLVLLMPCREYAHNSCGVSLSNKGSSLSLSSATVISSPAQCCTPRSTALGGMSTLLTT